jgi:hypothetical protein
VIAFFGGCSDLNTGLLLKFIIIVSLSKDRDRFASIRPLEADERCLPSDRKILFVRNDCFLCGMFNLTGILGVVVEVGEVKDDERPLPRYRIL